MPRPWDQYPEDYRSNEVAEIRKAVCAGDCVALIGLSGSGKSNLMSFLAHRVHLQEPCPKYLLIDCNHLGAAERSVFFHALRLALNTGSSETHTSVEARQDELAFLEKDLERRLGDGHNISFLLDRFDALYSWPEYMQLAGNLRALRDAYKFQLTWVIGVRQAPDPQSELAELFFDHTLWLGPLERRDALWSAARDAARFATASERDWSQPVLERLVDLSWGYPSLLRAVCEAYSAGCELTGDALRRQPAVARRVAEFWADQPSPEALRNCRLEGHPLLERDQTEIKAPGPTFDPAQLTAKEYLLLEYLRAHAGQVCDKDDLVRAVWPEDVIFAQGVRDESLAQLVRRLRVKIEPDPSEPRHIFTAPGRGYLFRS